MKTALIQSLYSLICAVVFLAMAILQLLCVPVALIPVVGMKLSSCILAPASMLLENLQRISDAFAEEIDK